jgi:two-component system OmpR family sensor kinase
LVTGWLWRNRIEVAWAAFAAANLVAMALWPDWETIPFHFVWISLTLLYGYRVWGTEATAGVLSVVVLATGALILSDAFEGIQLWGELFEVPLMSAMFLAMVWHARRRQDALRIAEDRAEENARLLSHQEHFLQDVSHELRTPVTIARGHVELAVRAGRSSEDLEVALDELERMNRIVERLLLLAKVEQPGAVVLTEVELESFLEDVFMRWSDVAQRIWRFGPVENGILEVDADGLRIALDALVENAVKYTEAGEAVVIRAHGEGHWAVIEVADGGRGISEDALDRIFDRFARADAARSRASGGVGLGLSIVDAIAKRHGGRCLASSSLRGSTFALRLPRFRLAAPSVSLDDARLGLAAGSPTGPNRNL